MAAGGHIITLVGGARPKTYIVAEPDREKAIALLSHKLRHVPIVLPEQALVSAETLKDHGVKPGQVKRLQL